LMKLTEEERKEKAKEIKERGNQLFKEGKF
jgi:hypothetical protein